MTPGCQPSRPRTIAPRSFRPPCAVIISWASSTICLLDLLALGVAEVERLGDLLGAASVVGREHLDGLHRPFEPAGGVDPGGEVEPDRPGVQLASCPGSRRPTARPGAPGWASSAQPGQAVADQDPVLAVDRHDVGDRGQRDQADRPDEEVAEVGRGFLAVAEALADLPGQLERHAAAAEFGERVERCRRAWDGPGRRPREGQCRSCGGR